MPHSNFQQLLWDLPAQELGDLLSSGLSVNEPDQAGDYLLTVASYRLQAESVQLLLGSGANPNVHNADGETPLLCAIDCVAHNSTAAVAIVESLIRSGANLEDRGYMDKTPYLKACSRGSLDMVKLLVRLGADPRATVNDGGVLGGHDFAEIFDGPPELKQFVRGLR